jgi:hypothetical protein
MRQSRAARVGLDCFASLANGRADRPLYEFLTRRLATGSGAVGQAGPPRRRRTVAREACASRMEA